MKKLLLAFCLPVGLLIELSYNIINRFITVIPDPVADCMMSVSVILMLIGIAYNGYCIGKKKKPYDFK